MFNVYKRLFVPNQRKLTVLLRIIFSGGSSRCDWLDCIFIIEYKWKVK